MRAPEAYTLKGALDGWAAGESNEQIRERAADAYDQYQKCGLRGFGIPRGTFRFPLRIPY